MVGEIVLFGLWCVLVWDLVRRAKAQKVEFGKLKRENFSLAAAVVKQGKRIDNLDDRLVDTTKRAMSEDDVIRESLNGSVKMLRNEFEPKIELSQDHEVRIAFLEKQLTSKTATAKIVPKATNWKQFRSAAEKASEQQETE